MAAIAESLPTLPVPQRSAPRAESENHAALDLPIAQIWGRDDNVTPPVQADAIRRELGKAPVFWMEDARHIRQTDAPDQFHENLALALAGVEQG